MMNDAKSAIGGANRHLGGLAALGAEVPLKTTKPVREALATLFSSVDMAQKSHQTLEAQLSSVLSTYPVNPFSTNDSDDTKRETSGCALSDDLYQIVRMVNSLVDRQEAMSLAVQL